MVGAKRFILSFAILFAGLTGQAAAGSDDAPGDMRVAALSLPPERTDVRCTSDRTECIRLASYVSDVCGVIEAAAQKNALDPNFFVRLIWKESLFDAAAVSPAGAQGIAQFMPDTARMRGLDDPFNPAEALFASAFYLAELARDFGNIGLAAVAYNGGEARAARFIAAKDGLPHETREYVHAITGYSAVAWRDAPPAKVDLALGGEADFQAACQAQAAARALREFRSGPPVLPWGVIVASNRDRDGAERQVGRLQNRFSAILAGEPVSYDRGTRPGMPNRLYMAQIGRESRAEADALCARLRQSGGDCMVLRN
jgi:soluble lytic murein transglycosylase-like protein